MSDNILVKEWMPFSRGPVQLESFGLGGYVFNTFSTPTHCPVHPPLHTFLKLFQGVAYTGKGSRETCPTGGAIWDDWVMRKLRRWWWCVLLFPHIQSMRNAYWIFGGVGVSIHELGELWIVGSKSWGQIGHLKRNIDKVVIIFHMIPQSNRGSFLKPAPSRSICCRSKCWLYVAPHL